MDTKRITSHDIAYAAGVSQPTVSRALRNSPLVNKATRDKIQAIARRMNYQVDVHASHLRTQKTKTLALLLCEDPGETLINPFFLALLGDITRATALAGYDLLLSFQQLSQDWQSDYQNSKKADGIIFLGYGDYNRYLERVTQLAQLGTAFVTWGPVLANQPGHFIGCNNLLGGKIAAQHLLKSGRQRIAFIGANSDAEPEFRERYHGYRLALDEAGATLFHYQVDAVSTQVSGKNATLHLFEQVPDIDAIVCASDVIAMGVLEALNTLGRLVPQQVSVVGFDNIPLAAHMQPPLTTVDQNIALAGQLLVDNVLQLIDGQSLDSVLLEPNLVIRGSCGFSTA